MTALHELTAVEIAKQVGDGTLTATDLVTALLERIAELEEDILAWSLVANESALAEAAERDQAAAAGERPRLLGVPIGVKDIIDVAGMPTVAGFAPYQDRIATTDADIVARLRAAGAIVLGKTHTTQFALSDPAPTRNPWHADRTPGGSSSGSGAAVAAQMVPVTLGTQTGGSVIRPAAYCGTVGFKPTYNWTSRDGILPLAWSLDHPGLLARTVEDIALVYGVITDTEVDLTAAPAAPRLAVLPEFLERSEEDVREHLLEVVERLRAAGAEVVEQPLPVDLDLLLAVHSLIMQAEVAAVHAEQLAQFPDDYGPLLRQSVEVGQLIPATYLLKAQRLRRQLGRKIDAALGEVDAVLLPPVSGVAPRRTTTGDRTFQAPASLLGIPAITLPTGLNADGLPFGTQVMARRGQDAALLGVAAWCAEAVGLIGAPDLSPPEPEPADEEEPSAAAAEEATVVVDTVESDASAVEETAVPVEVVEPETGEAEEPTVTVPVTDTEAEEAVPAESAESEPTATEEADDETPAAEADRTKEP